MIKILRVATENPKETQWRSLARYGYPASIQSYLRDRGLSPAADVDVRFIVASIQQSRAYFSAAENAPLDISPLLFYYGSTNILLGSATLLLGIRPPVKGHGMKLRVPTPFTRMADIEVIPVDVNTGALQHFSDAFSNSCPLVNGSPWTVGELFGSIPDLRAEYANQYSDTPFSVPVQEVRRENRLLDRILPDDISRFTSVEDVTSRIENYSICYLPAQGNHGSPYIILNRKSAGDQIGTYSITGRKHLQLSHVKGNQYLTPSQIITMYMSLFALGFISRYHPEIWNPFVRNDQSGERHIVERLLQICDRYLPNLRAYPGSGRMGG